MAKVNFGPRQTSNPTPQWAARLCDLLAGVCGIFSAFLVSAEFIPKGFSNIAGPILSGLLTPLFLYIKSWIGTELKGTSVPISEVTEVKEKP